MPKHILKGSTLVLLANTLLVPVTDLPTAAPGNPVDPTSQPGTTMPAPPPAAAKPALTASAAPPQQKIQQVSPMAASPAEDAQLPSTNPATANTAPIQDPTIPLQSDARGMVASVVTKQGGGGRAQDALQGVEQATGGVAASVAFPTGASITQQQVLAAAAAPHVGVFGGDNSAMSNQQAAGGGGTGAASSTGIAAGSVFAVLACAVVAVALYRRRRSNAGVVGVLRQLDAEKGEMEKRANVDEVFVPVPAAATTANSQPMSYTPFEGANSSFNTATEMQPSLPMQMSPLQYPPPLLSLYSDVYPPPNDTYTQDTAPTMPLSLPPSLPRTRTARSEDSIFKSFTRKIIKKEKDQMKSYEEKHESMYSTSWTVSDSASEREASMYSGNRGSVVLQRQSNVLVYDEFEEGEVEVFEDEEFEDPGMTLGTEFDFKDAQERFGGETRPVSGSSSISTTFYKNILSDANAPTHHRAVTVLIRGCILELAGSHEEAAAMYRKTLSLCDKTTPAELNEQIFYGEGDGVISLREFLAMPTSILTSAKLNLDSMNITQYYTKEETARLWD
ncbi:hypothetical protein HDU98_003668, partial [Podochytrium sp. JEL0797]